MKLVLFRKKLVAFHMKHVAFHVRLVAFHVKLVPDHVTFELGYPVTIRIQAKLLLIRSDRRPLNTEHALNHAAIAAIC